jgi:Tfp pilus assembly PilM family ATPase
MAKLPGLEDYLQRNLNIPVEVFNPFNKIKVSSDLSKYEGNLKELSSSLTAPIGLSGIEMI